MNVVIERTEPFHLARTDWIFSLVLMTSGRLDARLDEMRKLSRPSRRHKWRTAERWERGSSWRSAGGRVPPPPVPANVIAELERTLIEAVCKAVANIESVPSVAGGQ